MRKFSWFSASYASPDARQHQKTYIIPLDIKVRLQDINNQATKCIQTETPIRISVSDTPVKNAFYDPSNDGIVIATGMFDLDDHILNFVLAHEIAHGKVGHANSRAAVSYATTGAMLVLNAFVPGAGYLNHLVNPAVTNNYSKTQETEADLAAYNACLCMGMTREDIIFPLRAPFRRTSNPKEAAFGRSILRGMTV